MVMCFASCSAERPAVSRFEAEDAELVGLDKAPGAYSGTEYVTGFDEETDTATFRPVVPAGLYEVRIGYGTPHGQKGYSMTVNSRRTGGMLPGTGPGFAVHRAGRFLLKEGENTIRIRKGWGWWRLDYIELVPAALLPLTAPDGPLADSNADAAARRLYALLRDLYGRRVLTGQYNLGEIDWIREQTGLVPAVGGFDLMDHSPSRREFGADPGDITERIIEWGRSGGIVTISWHWNAPTDLPNEPDGREWWSGFYTRATDFDVEAALSESESEEHALLLRDLDVVAAELAKLRDAGIPVLWRPLHEGSGEWFWWGARGPQAFVKLWRLMFRRYTERHGLHNLIWVYTPGSLVDFEDWYPGDEFVDVVAPDVYTGPGDPMTGAWDPLHARFNGRKLLALGETGTLPPPEAPERFGVWWSWFCIWGDMVRRTPVEDLRAGLGSTNMVTKDELADWQQRLEQTHE
jgi:mannan endo-1,4-beta-mannosidase